MVIENAAVRAERARLKAEWEAGMAEGYEAQGPAPDWWFAATPGRMTARQRGYFVGRELRLQEEQEP